MAQSKIAIEFRKLLGFRYLADVVGGGAEQQAPGAHLDPPDEATSAMARAAGTIFNKEGETPASDRRLKRDIVRVGRLDNGLALYRYRYLWSDEVYVGVMAQEVAAIVPDAVVPREDGYLAVDYRKLGLRLMSWDEWTAKSQPAAAAAA